MANELIKPIKNVINFGSRLIAVIGKRIQLNNGGFKTPRLETVPPGGNGWPNKGRDAKRRLTASSVLNSIRSRLVTRKIDAIKKMKKKGKKADLEMPLNIDNELYYNYLCP